MYVCMYACMHVCMEHLHGEFAALSLSIWTLRSSLPVADLGISSQNHTPPVCMYACMY